MTPPYVSVCCVLPNFTMNGVSRWLISLAKLGRVNGYRIESVCLPEGAPTDTALCEELQKYGTVVCATTILHNSQNASEESRSVYRIGNSLGEVIRRTTNVSTVLLWYGVPNGTVVINEGPKNRLVVPVSHGPSEFTKSWLREIEEVTTMTVVVSACCAYDFPDATDTATLIFNGIDLSRATPSQSRIECRKDLGVFSKDTLVVGHVGRFSQEKNPLAICLAVDHLLSVKNIPDAVAVWIGEGPDEPQIKETVSKCLPSQAYKFFPPAKEVANVYEALDCFVLASEQEGFSLALTEAWANGVPTVCTPVGAIPELEALVEHELCVKVPVNPSGEELGEAILEAVTRTDLRANAMKFAREELTEEVMAENWSSLFQTVSQARKESE